MLQLIDGTRSFHADSITRFPFFSFFFFFFFLGRPCSPIPRAFSAISNQPLDLPFRGVPAFNCLLPARASMPRLFASSVCSKEMLTSCPHDWWTSVEEEAWNVIVQLLFLVPRKSTISCIEGTIVLWIRSEFFSINNTTLNLMDFHYI